jgi:hypothetical protein
MQSQVLTDRTPRNGIVSSDRTDKAGGLQISYSYENSQLTA